MLMEVFFSLRNRASNFFLCYFWRTMGNNGLYLFSEFCWCCFAFQIIIWEEGKSCKAFSSGSVLCTFVLLSVQAQGGRIGAICIWSLLTPNWRPQFHNSLLEQLLEVSSVSQWRLATCVWQISLQIKKGWHSKARIFQYTYFKVEHLVCWLYRKSDRI